MSKRRADIRISLATVLLFAIMTVTPGISPACTAFTINHDNGPIVGANFDWPVSDGLIVVNKKGFKKRAMSDPEKQLNPVSWTSRYGSVTFNFYGIAWPWAGMNEAGLVITSMQLEETQYPQPDERPSIHMGQWVQYQLDNFKTVDEVISHGEDIRIRPRVSGQGIHYLASDPTGNYAIVEFIDGRLLTYHKNTMPVAALANDPYARSIENLGNFQGFGGHRKIPYDNTSYCRFARTAAMIKQFDGGGDAAPVQFAFDTLDHAAYRNHPRTETQWSMVFDLSARSISLKTHLNPVVRTIEIKTLDYACRELPETLDIHTPFTKVRNNDFWKYNYEMNRRRFHGVFAASTMKSKTYQNRLERISKYPETFVCVD